MAQFIARIQGNRGCVSRCGSKDSGISATLSGWNLGCDVRMIYNEEKECDELFVEITGGSNHYNDSVLVFSADEVRGIKFANDKLNVFHQVSEIGGNENV